MLCIAEKFHLCVNRRTIRHMCSNTRTKKMAAGFNSMSSSCQCFTGKG